MANYRELGYNNLLYGGVIIDDSIITSANSDKIINKSVISYEQTTLQTIFSGQYIKSENFVSGTSGWRILGTGDVEFGSGTFRGSISATSGTIGGWTIGTNELYGTTTGTIKTSATAGVGANGVVLDKDGLRVYNSVLGAVVNLPSDGSAPTFSSGTITETTFEISTNAVLRTSATVGDGTANSAGVLINNTGIYACGASQTLANANVKILTTGSGTFKGTVNATSGYFGNATNGITIDSNGLTVAGTGYIRTASSGTRIQMLSTLGGSYTHGIEIYNGSNLRLRMSGDGGVSIFTDSSDYGITITDTLSSPSYDGQIYIGVEEAKPGIKIQSEGTTARQGISSILIDNDSESGIGIDINNSSSVNTEPLINITSQNNIGFSFYESPNSLYHFASGITNQAYLQFFPYFHYSDFDEKISGDTALASTSAATEYWTGGGTNGTQKLICESIAGTRIKLETTDTASSTSTMQFGRSLFKGEYTCMMECFVYLHNNTNCKYLFGFWQSDSEYAVFKYDTSVSSTNIYAETKTARGTTTVDTLEDIATNVWKLFKILNTGTAVYFFINNVLFKTITTHVPNNFSTVYFYVDNKDQAENKKLSIDFVKIWQGRDRSESLV